MNEYRIQNSYEATDLIRQLVIDKVQFAVLYDDKSKEYVINAIEQE